MCLLCIEIEQERIKPLEAWTALKELVIEDKTHEKELLHKLHKYTKEKGVLPPEE